MANTSLSHLEAGPGGPPHRPHVSRFDPFLPRRSRARHLRGRSRLSTPTETARRFRTYVAIAGVGVAIAAAVALPSAPRASAMAYLGLALFFQLFWLGSLIPFALPHYSTMIAFGYLIGWAVIPLEYLMRLISLPIMVWLARRGLFDIPRPLRELIGEPEERNPNRFAVWTDLGATTALAAFGLAARIALFAALARLAPGLGPLPRILLCEAAVLGVLALAHPRLPLPTAEELSRNGPFRWRLDDERIDLALHVVLLAPMLVVLINMSFILGGLAAAVFASLAGLGPHYVAKLLSDRLSDVALLLEEKHSELKDLVYTIAHDLKAPVSAVLLTADSVLQRDGARLSAETREDLDRIQRLAARTEDRVRDMLHLFRVVWADERPGRVDLQALASATAETLRPQLIAHGATLQIGALPTIWGQRGKLEQVFVNLLSNAVRHLPDAHGRIEITATIGNGTATLCVADNGPGIPLEWHGRIFDLFVCVPGSAGDGGSGVGLAIVRRVLEAHGGQVWVESAPGSGSRFFARLPVVPVPV